MVCLFVIIILVIYLANNLFNDILHGNDTGSTTKLVYHDGHVYLILLEITQKVINHLCFRYKIWGTNEALPLERCRFLKMRQEVFNIKHTLNVVCGTLVNRDTAIVILYDTLYHLWERSLDIKVYHIHTRSHHLSGHLTTETYNTL